MLVESSLMTSNLQYYALAAAESLLHPQNECGSSQKKQDHLLDVISHPTDPKVYAMLTHKDFESEPNPEAGGRGVRFTLRKTAISEEIHGPLNHQN